MPRFSPDFIQTVLQSANVLERMLAAANPTKWDSNALGIDVSGWVDPKNCDFQKWHDENGLEFVMARMSCTDQQTKGDAYDPTNYVDRTFSTFCDMAYNVKNKHGGYGIPFGGYHYWGGRPAEVQSLTKEGDPQYQAFKASFKRAQIGKSIHWVTLDLEDHGETNSNTSRKANVWYHWMTGDHDLDPIWRMVYTSMGFLNTYSPDSIVWLGGPNEDIPLHMAQWPWSGGKVMDWPNIRSYSTGLVNVKTPGVAKTWRMVQWAGDAAGLCKNGMDLNYFNGTYQDLYKWLGFTPRNATPEPPTPPVPPEPTSDVTRAEFDALTTRVKAIEDWRHS